jgi:branched-chain amino acid transport system permease protein
VIAYLTFIATLTGIYAILTMGLVVSWGQGGMVNLGLVGFFGLGAYASALLVGTGAPIGIGWALATSIACLVGVAFCLLTRTLRGDYLAIITLGFAEAIRLVETNERWLTNGTDGISGIRAPLKDVLGPAYPWFYLLITWLIVALAFLVLRRVLRSPFGRALRAVRDDEQVAGVAGKPVLRLKFQAFGIGAGLAGLAGAMYAHFTSFIAPDNFGLQLTIYIFLAATAGGYTRLRGAIVGAFLVMVILEGSRFLAAIIPGLSAVQIASLRELAIAATLILILQLRPEGLFAMVNQTSGLERTAQADRTA